MTDELPKLSDKLAVLKMHVDLANGEKQAIWTRHATMLVGNSIIVAAAKSEPAAQKRYWTAAVYRLGGDDVGRVGLVSQVPACRIANSGPSCSQPAR